MNQEVIEKLQRYIELLAKRPGMYVGEDCSLPSVANHIYGYFQALYDLKLIVSVSSWSQWVQLNHKRWDPMHTWWEILEEELGSEQEVLNKLPDYFSRFLEAASGNGEALILEKYSNVGKVKNS